MLLGHPVQHLAEGRVDQLILLPDVFAGAVMVEVEGFLFALRVVEPVHVVQEMGKDDLPVRDIRNPFRFPFQGDEPAVVDGIQGVHHLRNRNGAFADQVVVQVLVRVAQVDMADVSAQVADRGVRRFRVVAEGMVHIPQRGQLVAGIVVHQGAQLRGVRENADRLDKHAHAALQGFPGQEVQPPAHLFVIFLQGADGDVGDLHRGCRPDQLRHLFDVFRRVGQVEGSVQAGNLQPLVPQRTHGFVPVVLVEGAGAVRQRGAAVEIVYLDSLEAELRSVPDLLLPGKVPPSAG